MDEKKVQKISGEFSLSYPTTLKYIHMTEEEITALDNPTSYPYKKRQTVMDDYINIIYKMLRDKREPAVIMSYVIKKGYDGSLITLKNYITVLAKNNFNRRLGWHNFEYPDDITVIKRNELLRYIVTKNPKGKKNDTIAQNLSIVKEKYNVITVLEEVYNEFYEILMGNEPDKLEAFIDKYEASEVGGFIEGIEKDIAPVKSAISCDESSGFVEGNNNKLKLIKRIAYGRSGLVNLFKKGYVAFKATQKNFSLRKLLHIDVL